MAEHHILVVEDDTHIRRGLVDALESEGYATQQAPDGRKALAQFSAQRVDLVLLDLMMPEMSGYDVCRELRRINPGVPIIMLTAKGEEVDKVVGLQLGADDYITKPFGVRELLARVDAVLRRCRRVPESVPEPGNYRFGAAEIDRKKYTSQLVGKTSPLTSREVKLLDFFHAHPDEVLSRDDLLNAVWGVEYYGTTRTLDQHIAQLRKKVEIRPATPRTILTMHGVGYRYVPAVP